MQQTKHARKVMILSINGEKPEQQTLEVLMKFLRQMALALVGITFSANQLFAGGICHPSMKDCNPRPRAAQTIAESGR